MAFLKLHPLPHPQHHGVTSACCAVSNVRTLVEGHSASLSGSKDWCQPLTSKQALHEVARRDLALVLYLSSYESQARVGVGIIAGIPAHGVRGGGGMLV